MVPNNLQVRITALCVSAGFLLTCEGSGTTEIREIAPVAVVEISPGIGTVEMGEALQLTAIPMDASGNELHRRVTWSSLNPLVVEADCAAGSDQLPATCEVAGVAWGTAVITATSEGIQGMATVEVPDNRVSVCSRQSQIPEAECLVLGTFYEVTGGVGWRDREGWWLSNTPCRWHGVQCQEGFVRGLYFYDNQLTGIIPPEIEQLSSLEDLHISINQLGGPIPPELGNLANLRGLDLGDNQLTGPIPAELGNLATLETLELGNNQLIGPIPPELGNLSELWLAVLYLNHLNGPIPAELGNLSNLLHLHLDYNELAGLLPPELGNLTNLQSLTLEHNGLSGSIPTEWGNLSSLSWVGLRWNQLGGVIPLDVAILLGRVPTCDASPGNDGLEIPDTEAYRSADLDGDGLICGIPFTSGLAPNASEPA